MLRQSLKIILRSFRKNKFYSTSLLAGFSLAFSISFLLAVYLIHELSTDHFHSRYKDIYRVLMNEPISMEKGIITFQELPAKLINSYPEVELATHIYYPHKTRIYKGNSLNSDLIDEESLFYADTSFLSIFTFNLIRGDVNNALKEPGSILITQAAAQQYFGTFDVVDRQLYIEKQPYTITGLIEDPVENTQFRFNLLISKTSLRKSTFPLDFAGVTYIRLKEGSNAEELEAKLENNQNQIFPFEPEKKMKEPFTLQPLSETYFYQNIPGHISAILKTGNQDFIRMLKFVAIIILVLSIFNYLNFSQSKAIFTLRENLIKRIFGASKSILKWHITFEAGVLVLMSALLSIFLIALILPAFNQLFATNLRLSFLSNPVVFTILILGVCAVTLILGFASYYFLARSLNTPTLSVKLQKNSVNTVITNTVFVVQLAGSTILVTTALVIFSQVNFLKNHSPGYQTKNIIEIDLSNLSSSTSLHALKDEINKIPGVISSTLTYGSPLTGRWTTSLKTKNTTVELGSYNGDEDYVKTFELNVIEGRSFNREIASDTNAILINESGKKLLQLDENFEPEDKEVKTASRIIGVVQDFNYFSFKETIGPAVIGYSPFLKVSDFGGTLIAIKLSAITSELMAQINAAIKKTAPDEIFDYTLLDENYRALHQKEESQLNMVLSGGFISVLISIFGLLGLSFFISARKSKEVAIRKTLGASTLTITGMFIKRLLLLAGISFLISIPLSISFTNRWIAEFAYKTDLSPGLWILAILVMIVILLLSVSQLLYTAATKNPIEALRQD